MTLADLLARPTSRPDEPITAGLSVGPGAGPEVLAGFLPKPTPGDIELIASLPGASAEIRALAEELAAFEPDPGEIAIEL